VSLYSMFLNRWLHIVPLSRSNPCAILVPQYKEVGGHRQIHEKRSGVVFGKDFAEIFLSLGALNPRNSSNMIRSILTSSGRAIMKACPLSHSLFQKRHEKVLQFKVMAQLTSGGQFGHLGHDAPNLGCGDGQLGGSIQNQRSSGSTSRSQ
jgi:hypothetical protein